MSESSTLFLGSGSPRRQQLLKEAGYCFEVVTFDLAEHFPETIDPLKVAQYLATMKNSYYRQRIREGVLITADTTVIHNQLILEKPSNHSEAFDMIQSLSGTSHLVITGVCISDVSHEVAFSNQTEVLFHPLSANEINFYIDRYRPFDKAGSYGIQEWIGLTRIKSITGSYFNVMGLPVDEVYHHLKEVFRITPYPQ